MSGTRHAASPAITDSTLSHPTGMEEHPYLPVIVLKFFMGDFQVQFYFID